MQTLGILNTFGFVPSLSMRPALALLVLSVAITFGWVAGPVWLIGTVPIIILLLVTIGEWNLGKDGFFIDLFEMIMPFIKVVLAIAIALILLEGESSNLLEVMINDEAPWWQEAGKWSGGLLQGVFVWYANLYRQSYLLFITEIDEDNELGLLTLYTWLEGLFAAINIPLAIIFPIAAIVLYLVVILCIWLLRRYLERQENKKRVACTNDCGTQIYSSALNCPTCYTKNPAPFRIGVLGQTTSAYVKDRYAHSWELLAQKRCPRCATQFRGKNMHQMCEACGESVLDSPEAVQGYVQYFDKKLPLTLTICAALGIVPLVGLVVGIVYYRLTLVSPMRRYVPVAQGCLGKWGTRLINFVLLTFQPLPVVGAFILPLMCFINYRVYRGLVISSQFRSVSPKLPVQKLA
ncbi:MAG: hypothetical protein DWQ04_10755 [Chloroflexi bacterium]|nr:MAG: hypothetical protein DWQ04_10755 [Chloroflexota bacterium]